MKLSAALFRLILKPGFCKKYFYLIRKRIFLPLGLFRGTSVISSYSGGLKIRLNLDEWIQQHIYFLGAWDEPGINFIKKHLEEDDIFFDLGANIGSYSLIASKIVGDKGRVFAFEPSSKVFEQLLSNIEMNHIHNIVAEKKALSQESGMVRLYISRDDNMGMSGVHRHESESGITEDVEAVSLDEYIAGNAIPGIKMIKIDIEGSELYALRGMKRTIIKYNPVIILELSEDVLSLTPYTAGDIIRFMKELNYHQKGINATGELTDPVCVSNYSNYVFLPGIQKPG